MSELPKGSVFVSDDAPVYDVPVSVINRPLPSTLDDAKVQQFVEDMKAGADFTPIEVAWVQEGGHNYYFAFGGCHRWAAVKQLGLPTIRARLIKVSPATINVYLGASSPFRKKQEESEAAAGATAAPAPAPAAHFDVVSATTAVAVREAAAEVQSLALQEGRT